MEGDGGFFVQAIESKDHKLKYRVRLRYEVCQDIRDKQLMSMLVDFFGCGNIYVSGTIVKYAVFNYSDIVKNIIPVFNKYNIIGVKYQNYLDWCEVAKMMENKIHLTDEGLQRIIIIINRMNRNRKW